jgi:hypothetical protein
MPIVLAITDCTLLKTKYKQRITAAGIKAWWTIKKEYVLRELRTELVLDNILK